MEVHLVADTNLFFECKSLKELPWSELRYDPVVILLTKPVLDEIGEHKYATSRTRQRAIHINSLVRRMLDSNLSEIEICAASPKVILRRTQVAPDPAHAELLDYTKTDERLVGIVSTLAKQASNYDVKLFTDDLGPADAAHSMGIPFILIDPTWRRPASKNKDEQKIAELEKELADFRAQEPQISFGRCAPADDSGKVEMVRKIATPLAPEEVEEFLKKLSLKHPLTTDFTPPPPLTTTDDFGARTTIEFSAPAEAEITNYRDVLYPQWLAQCRALLRGLHEGRDEIEPDILLRWPIENKGTRPAVKARIEFETRGPLMIQRPRRGEQKRETETASQTVAARPQFPPAPKAPAFGKNVTHQAAPEGRKPAQGFNLARLRAAQAGVATPVDWSKVAGVAVQLSHFSKSQDLKAFLDLGQTLKRSLMSDKFLRDALLKDPFITDSPRSSLSAAGIDHNLHFLRKAYHHEGFHFEGSALDTKGAFTCGLWRHQSKEEIFEFEVLFTKPGESHGLVECTVHAENLTKSLREKVIIRRSIERLSMIDLAETMVADSK